MAEAEQIFPFSSSSSSESSSPSSTQQTLEPTEPYINNTNYSSSSSSSNEEDEEEEKTELLCESGEEDFESAWRQRSVVMLEGYVESSGGGSDEGSEGVGRTKSLTDDDLEELKGCLDLGFGFSYEEIPELCETLPALELCYSLSQRFLDEQQLQQQQKQPSAPVVTTDRGSDVAEKPNTNWRISGPGDDPEEVKARLKYWAQAVACTVKLCS